MHAKFLEIRCEFDAALTPCPFPDLTTLGKANIVTSHLDEGQEQQLEAAHSAALMRSCPRSIFDPHVKYSFRSSDPLLKQKTRLLDC
ncbi:hypothetical protein Plhal304r1_c056g0142091 [Plasmopara halstedii]